MERIRQTRVKMCGMRRSQDVKTAIEAGADMIGAIFYEKSPRFVTLENAREISNVIKPGVSLVTLFVNADEGYIREVLKETHADLIQFHGDEPPEFCQQFGKRYVKAIRAKSADYIHEQLERHAEADGLMLDAFVKGIPGGTGQAFDWSLIPRNSNEKLFLAGGLDPSNVGEAILEHQPYTVDVAGGIELEKGVKSEDKIYQFMSAVRDADRRLSEISS